MRIEFDRFRGNHPLAFSIVEERLELARLIIVVMIGNVALQNLNERIEALVCANLSSGQIADALSKICHQIVSVLLSSGKTSHQAQDLVQVSHEAPVLLNKFFLLL